jgi:hypothetical protein
MNAGEPNFTIAQAAAIKGLLDQPAWDLLARHLFEEPLADTRSRLETYKGDKLMDIGKLLGAIKVLRELPVNIEKLKDNLASWLAAQEEKEQESREKEGGP